MTERYYEASEVVDAFTDAIFFTDQSGCVQHANPAAEKLVGNARERDICHVLGLGHSTFSGFLGEYALDSIHEVEPDAVEGNWLLRIIALPDMCMSCAGYVVILTDNNPLITMQESFEDRFDDNLSMLSDSIRLFNSLFEASPDSALLVDNDLRVIAANTATSELFACKHDDVVGKFAAILVSKSQSAICEQRLRTLKAGESISQEFEAVRKDRKRFPAEFTARRVDLDSGSVLTLFIRDLSNVVRLEEGLDQKTAEVEDMNVTLKNVISAVEEEKQSIREDLASRVTGEVLPALERMAEAEHADKRQDFKDVIAEQLLDISGHEGGQTNPGLLKLTPREMDICRLVQLGRSGKEIAELLAMSFETVQTHRKNIRRKLGLRGRKQSLFSYLQSTFLKG